MTCQKGPSSRFRWLRVAASTGARRALISYSSPLAPPTVGRDFTVFVSIVFSKDASAGQHSRQRARARERGLDRDDIRRVENGAEEPHRSSLTLAGETSGVKASFSSRAALRRARGRSPSRGR